MTHIRPARPADAATVAAYHHRCWELAFAPLLGPGVVEQFDPRRRLPLFQLWFAEGQHEVTALVAEVDGVVVAHTTIEGNEVVHLFVDPEHWGTGIGSYLLAEAERRIADAGFADAQLTTMVGNEPAIALYRRAGWRVTDEIVRTAHGDVAFDEHVLRKDLRPAQ